MTKRGSLHYAWAIMIGCCFLQAGGLGAVLNTPGVFFPAICAELGVGVAPLALYLTLYFLFTSLSMPFVAKMLPRWNIRITLTVAFVFVAVALGMMSTYTELWQFYLSGVVFGIAGGFIFMVPATVLIENWFDEKRSLALGISQAFAGLSGAIFAIALNRLIYAIGWRMTYVVLAVVICILVLPWTLFVFRFKPSDMGLKPYGYREDADQGETVKHENRGISGRAALGTSAFWLILIFCGIESLFSGYNNAFPTYGISIGLGDTFGSQIVSVAMIGGVVLSVFVGWLMDRIGVLKTTWVILGTTALMFFGFVFLRNPALLLVCAFFFGINGTVVTLSVATLIAEIFGRRCYTEILSYSRMAGLIAAFGSSAVGLSYDLTGSFNTAFFAGVAICVICMVLVAIAWSQRQKLVARWTTAEEDELAKKAA